MHHKSLGPTLAGEARLGRKMARRHWTAWLYDFLRFGMKQPWACLFGGIAVAPMIATYKFYPQGAPLARYDFLFLCMVAVQIALLAGGMETCEEEDHFDLSSRRHGDGDIQNKRSML